MNSSAKPPLLLPSLLRSKCPACRKGDVFQNSRIFPLSTCLDVKEYCSVCKQKIRIENNYGQGMNFVFIFLIFLFNLLWFWPAIGISLMDNSIYYYLAISVFMTLVLQPWIMRFSRVLFLYLVIMFDEKTADVNYP
jgi:uncharacterized protein (DUF983 family)